MKVTEVLFDVNDSSIITPTQLFLLRSPTKLTFLAAFVKAKIFRDIDKAIITQP